MLSQEVIYQYIQSKEYTKVIILLHENGNSLDDDKVVLRAIGIFMDVFFDYVKIADGDEVRELNQDLDILFLSHVMGKYLLKDVHLLSLIHLVKDRTATHLLYDAAKRFPEDGICREIVEAADYNAERLRLEREQPYRPVPIVSARKILGGQKFQTETGQRENVSWIKVYLRSNELLDIVAGHMRKLSSVDRINVTDKGNGHSDLTVYARKPFSIEETHEEINLTLDNYFSRSPVDPIFKEEVISGISDVAYFQILDYMLKLGIGLEGFRSLSIKMDEERYRDYFVNYLDSLSNNHTATGETFHGVGKTDILIRNQAKEVLLVAECKLWGGAAHLAKAIDQLFTRYIAWRDGKAALLIFNTKASGFTKIIETAVNVVKGHSLCAEFVGQRSETSYSFLFRNHRDPERSIRLELILFNFS